VATGRLPDPNSAPVTAKGDLYTYSTVPAKLAVGNNGETLLADSSTSTGLRWTGANQQNPIINGAFDVWQRGTSFTVAASTYTFTADRFEVVRGATGLTVSRQSTNDTTNLPQIRYCARIARDSGNTSTSAIFVDHSIETTDSIRYTGQTVTISFYARVGANYSPTSSALKVKGVNGTGTDQAIKNYTGANLFINSTVNLTTTWARFTATGTVPTNSTEIGIEFEVNPTGTAGANDWVEITGIQIDLGSTALPYRRSASTLQGELAACKYYFRRYGGNANFEGFGVGQVTSTTGGSLFIPFETGMRATPVGAYAAASNFAVHNSTGSGVALTSISTDVLTKMGANLSFAVASGLTAGNAGYVRANNTSSATIDFSAEL
jgi:hypothetical protein